MTYAEALKLGIKNQRPSISNENKSKIVAKQSEIKLDNALEKKK